MVNMYSMASYGKINNAYSSGIIPQDNIHQNFKAKYGVGYEDFGTTPYANPYPMGIVPRAKEPFIEKSWLGRFIAKCFYY